MSQEPNWKTETKVCPTCKQSKPVDPGFGLREHVNGRKYAQSICVDCRKESAKASYENQKPAP